MCTIKILRFLLSLYLLLDPSFFPEAGAHRWGCNSAMCPNMANTMIQLPSTLTVSPQTIPVAKYFYNILPLPFSFPLSLSFPLSSTQRCFILFQSTNFPKKEYIYIPKHIHIYIYLNIYIHINISMCIHIHMLCMYMHIYMHIHNMLMCIYTYIYMCVSPPYKIQKKHIWQL